jgi:hypothetical protein
LLQKIPVDPRLFDWIWHVRGRVALGPGQTSDDAFARLDPLFREAGTSHERTGDTLSFRKKDQAAQDKMSVFDGGVLQIEAGAVENGTPGPVLRYDLTSRALLFCFLLPLLFLGFAQLTIASGKFETPPTAAEKAAAAAKKAKKAEMPMHPLDKALGAPAPKKADADKDKDKKPSPTPAYVFAAIFAVLYLIGRVLEARLVKSLFRKTLLGA